MSERSETSVAVDRSVMHRCPALPTCKRWVPKEKAFCSAHWVMLPGDIKREIEATWKRRHWGGTNGYYQHLGAIKRAIAWLRDRET